MSLFPEVILAEVIAAGIDAVRENPKLIDQLMRNVPQRNTQEFVDILRNPIEILLHWPQREGPFPCIVVSPRGFQESYPVLGDQLGHGYTPEVSGVDQGFYYDSDSTSQSTVSLPGDGGVGEPRRLYDRKARQFLRHEGVMDKHTIHISVYAPREETVAFLLFPAVRFILLSSRMTLEAEGLQNLSIAGSGLSLAEEFSPTVIFGKTLVASFDALFSWSVVEPLLKAIQVRMKVAAQAGGSTETILTHEQLPAIISLAPSSASQGSSLTGAVLSGTNIRSGATIGFGSSGVTASQVEYIGMSQLRYSLTVSLTAPVAAYTVTVTNTDSIKATLPNGFAVTL